MPDSIKPTVFQRLRALLVLERREIGYIFLYALLGGLINLVLPLGIQSVINIVNGGAISSGLWVLVGVVGLGTLFAGLLFIMQMTVSETLQRRIFTRYSFDFAARLPKLQTEAMPDTYLPEMANRFFETLTLQKSLPKLLIDLITAFMQIFFGLLLLSFYHSLFIFFGITLLFLMYLIYRITWSSGLKTSLLESKYKFKVVFWLQEVARTQKSQLFGRSSDLALEKTDTYVESYLDSKRDHFRILMTQYFSVVIFKTLITVILLSLGAWLVVNNLINVGQFVSAEIIFILILSSSEKMITAMDSVFDVMTALEKLGAVEDLPIESDGGSDFGPMIEDKPLALATVDLSYKFPQAEHLVLNQLSFEIRSGERVCVAGYNGSGKSTLMQVLAATSNIYEGQLLYNGVTRRNFNSSSLYAAISYFSSRSDLFDGTIMENITLGNQNFTVHDVVKQCERLGLMSFISTLPLGLNTKILPEGSGLPDHVTIKLSLARALMGPVRLLVVDEMMDNFNNEDRLIIAEILTNPNRTWTLVVASNDPTMAAKCDRVLVLDKGKLVADGSYQEVLATQHGNQIFSKSGSNR
jgi:ABC-type bacteriocin/lantibiotic exporter with double-glycine peptidase domain